MNILASVYACSPYDGSERAVGWNWIVQLDKYHSITALTSHVYQKDIEDYCKKNPNVLKNTHFVYIDVPHTSWHVGYRFERLYYILWQREALKVAKKLMNKEKFALVHHITYVTCILPTYMHKLEIPFVYGPVSGGENIPSIIDYPMSKKDALIEKIRYISQMFFRMTPNYYRTMRQANVILTTTEETKNIIPFKYKNKVEIFQAIGLTEELFDTEPKKKRNEKIRILVAGRMMYWKGFELAIEAFISALKKGCKAELVVLGDTEEKAAYIAHKESLRKSCGNYYGKQIKFIPKVPHSEMKEFYDSFDILLNCSLRDSGCFIVMEAMSRGLPIICVDTGGPKINTTDDCAIKIKPASMKQMIDQISKAIIEISDNTEKREKMGKAARQYAAQRFLISKRTEKMNEFYSKAVEK